MQKTTGGNLSFEIRPLARKTLGLHVCPLKREPVADAIVQGVCGPFWKAHKQRILEGGVMNVAKTQILSMESGGGGVHEVGTPRKHYGNPSSNLCNIHAPFMCTGCTPESHT